LKRRLLISAADDGSGFGIYIETPALASFSRHFKSVSSANAGVYPLSAGAR
jgi:hypothetical protein